MEGTTDQDVEVCSVRLFDDGEREYTGPASEAESDWSFLNRSGWPYFIAAREVIEDWFSRYPAYAANQLRARLRKTDKVLHASAFWELYLHELVTRLRCSSEIEPSMSAATSRRPDFLVTSPAGSRFYVEAVVARNESPADVAIRARTAALFDALNRIRTPDFFLDVQLTVELTESVRIAPIRDALQKLLSTVDHALLAEQFQSGHFAGSPSWCWPVPGGTLSIRPLPRGPKMRGRLDVRPVGIYPTHAHWVDAKTYLRKSLVEKAGRYGHDLGAPYIIAVNAMGDRPEIEDVAEVLFGRPADRASRGAPGLLAPTRHTQVTAVLVVPMVTTSTFPHCDGHLWVNPWARQSLPAALSVLPRIERIDGTLLERAGTPLHVVLGDEMQQLESVRWDHERE